MSIIVICDHAESGNVREFDITNQHEFKRRYGHLRECTWPTLAAQQVTAWNFQGKRTGHRYTIKEA